MSQLPKDKSEFKRQLINEHVPYELVAFATMRYYANLQALGLFDIVGNMMDIEGISEQQAIDKCMEILHNVSVTQAKFSKLYTYLTTEDRSGLSDRVKQN